MIWHFEDTAKRQSHDVFFRYVDDVGVSHAYTYGQTRSCAAGLAMMLQDRGLTRGSGIAVDMPNCPAFVFLALAAGYAGFTLVALNHRLTAEEKASRIQDLSLAGGIDVSITLSECDVEAMLKDVPTKKVDDFAEKARAGFDCDTPALIMFTSGTTGRPKAVCLSWGNLTGSAESANAMLNRRGEGLWQAALPLFHIGGFQIVVRSVLNETPFILYRKFSAKRMLDDVAACGATHASVVDKMLQDLLATDELAPKGERMLSRYRCLLLGGAAPNPATIRRARAANAAVYASYGMTETSSLIAISPISGSPSGTLSLLRGYEVRVVDPDMRGAGQLAVRGPGVFLGYLNADTPRTPDGFFLTGDTASFRDGSLAVFERTKDMFVSGGENVYPAEIAGKIMDLPHVGDAYVFGAEDPAWGRRPIAFVERGQRAGHDPSFPTEAGVEADAEMRFKLAEMIRSSLARRVSKLYQPDRIFVLDEFPRTGVGKTDRRALRQAYGQRLEVKRVTLYRIRQKLANPFATAKTVMRSRESVIVEVEDHAGRTGIGECVAFPSDWYLPETLDDDVRVLEKYLTPLVLSQVYLHPSEVSASFARCREAAVYPLARGALEPAMWDLYGKIIGKPLWQIIGGMPTVLGARESIADSHSRPSATVQVRAGFVLGIMSIDDTLSAVRRFCDAGYGRVKLKVRPGEDYERVRAVRKAHPRLTIMLDANQSYTESDFPALRALDTLDIYCIEEPLDPMRTSGEKSVDLFSRLANLQQKLNMRVCLDESIVGREDLRRALSHPELTCYAVKIGKLGGVRPALDFYREAAARGIELWMGGMYETSVSKWLHAAFETLPGVDTPGDISETARYFDQDITIPPLEVEQGSITLNQNGHETGLGCDLDYDAIARVLLERHDYA